jgi:hypothetical protein
MTYWGRCSAEASWPGTAIGERLSVSRPDPACALPSLTRTSLMLLESVKNMTNRSIPIPQPPVGGKPYSSLLHNSSVEFNGTTGHSEYARVHKGLVDTLCLVITLSLLPALLLESLSLVEGIVQLGVGVADFLGSNESLETFTDTRSRSVVLGERRHDLRVTNYCRTGHLVIVLSRRMPADLPMKDGLMHWFSMYSPTSWRQILDQLGTHGVRVPVSIPCQAVVRWSWALSTRHRSVKES